jgi:hypothetical protein
MCQVKVDDNMKKIIPAMLVFLFLLVGTAQAGIYWDYMQFIPLDGFSVANGTIMNFSATIICNGTDSINGTLCLTVDTSTGLGVCGTVIGGCVGQELSTPFAPYLYGYSAGSYFWRANYTHNDSTVYYSDSRNWNLIYTDEVLIPRYPIQKENVTGDNTKYMVNYTVDVIFPDSISSNRYIYFYAYSSYLGIPLLSSERWICEYELKANYTNPKPAGTYTIGCENYMYDSFIINYEELPSYNPKYWRAKLRVLKGEIDGANLLSNTGFQEYNYRITSKLADIFPPNDGIFCDATLFIFNLTWYNIENICFGKTPYHSQFIPFTSYINDSGCGGGNLTMNIFNAINTSQKTDCQNIDVLNNTIDYYECDVVINPLSTNTTLTFGGQNYVAIHIYYNSTYDCKNSSSYVTPNSEIWYIIGISTGIGVNISTYPTYPLPINMSAFMPYLSTYWASAFNTNAQAGLAFIAFFFLLVLAILVLINMEVVAGIAVFIYGLLVFIRIGYIPTILMYLMLIITGLIFVYLMRKFMLSRRS